jgi:hypothetical protein
VFVDKLHKEKFEEVDIIQMLHEHKVDTINRKLKKVKDKYDYYRRRIHAKWWIENEKERQIYYNLYNEYKKLTNDRTMIQYDYDEYEDKRIRNFG